MIANFNKLGFAELILSIFDKTSNEKGAKMRNVFMHMHSRLEEQV
jgi:hypothetical protein